MRSSYASVWVLVSGSAARAVPLVRCSLGIMDSGLPQEGRGVQSFGSDRPRMIVPISYTGDSLVGKVARQEAAKAVGGVALALQHLRTSGGGVVVVSGRTQKQEAERPISLACLSSGTSVIRWAMWTRESGLATSMRVRWKLHMPTAAKEMPITLQRRDKEEAGLVGHISSSGRPETEPVRYTHDYYRAWTRIRGRSAGRKTKGGELFSLR